MPDLRDKGPAGLNLLGAAEAAEKIAQGEITSEALITDCLKRIEAREETVGAWAFIDPELALAQARDKDRSASSGPLHGVPVGIKDVLDTKDMPTAYGSAIHAGHQPGEDTATVAALKAAGAVILGKTVTTEFACPFPVHTTNPHDPERTPGVSSSGSAAAVADFMVPLANGTQTGGSVIRPATLCGTYGYKASIDGLDRTGIRHLKPSIDTLGLFARALPDIALMRGALTGTPPADLDAVEGQGPKIGVCRTFMWASALPETVALMEGAAEILAEAGAETVEVELHADVEKAMAGFRAITSTEGARSMEDEIRDHLESFNPWSKASVEESRRYDENDVAEAKGLADRGRARLAETFERVDVLITPAAQGEAPRDLKGVESQGFNALWTQMHVPAVTVPAFTGPDGMPLGLQIIGPAGTDDRTLALANWIDRRLLQAGGGAPLPVG